MLDVELRPRAQLDLESIYLYLTAVAASPQAADAALDGIYASIERLAEFPHLGSVFQDASLKRPYRRMLSGRHWIYYTHDEQALTVWRIFNTSQDIDDFTFVELP